MSCLFKSAVLRCGTCNGVTFKELPVTCNTPDDSRHTLLIQRDEMKTLFASKSVKIMKEQLQQQSLQINEATQFIQEIQKGNFNVSVSEQLAKTKLGSALISIKEHLDNVSRDEERRNWLNVGLAKFADILRNKKSLDLTDLSDDILLNLVRYLNVNQGAIFILEDEGKGDEYLKMLACYAYDRKKFLEKRIHIGEGLAGQCVLEKEIIYLREVPANHVTITSGLGQATPKTVLISPLLIEEKVFGVLELASFQELEEYKIEFVKKLSENIASTIKNAQESERIVSLLNSSQQQAEELRSQEEEMRQNMEELQATQEEMQRRNEEINRVAAEMTSIVNGINATMATIEFKPDGTILNANENFLKAVKYPLSAIKGKHHRMFVPAEIVITDEYRTFWSRLAEGKSFAGVFKRVAADGRVIWLNAIYNPILDSRGQVTKIVKFASDITAQQELEAENKGILEGINATMAVIEFTPTGVILSANDNFQRTMKCNLQDIVGKHHKMFVPHDILVTEEYQAFWQKLAMGESMTGVFKRKNFTEHTVWLNAIYNPIKNAAGDVVKIVKFATDVTSQHEIVAGNEY